MTNDKKMAERYAECPRCGGAAESRFADSSKTKVEVRCPDCGRFTLPRAEFDVQEMEVAGPAVGE